MEIKYCKAIKEGRLKRDWIFDNSPGFTVTMVFEPNDVCFYYVSDFNGQYVIQKGNPYEPYPYAVPNDIWITKAVFDLYFVDIPDPGFRRNFPPINNEGTSGSSGKAEYPSTSGHAGKSGCSGHSDWPGYTTHRNVTDDTPPLLVKFIEYRNKSIAIEWIRALEHDVTGDTMEECMEKANALNIRVKKRLDEITARYNELDKAIDDLEFYMKHIS